MANKFCEFRGGGAGPLFPRCLRHCGLVQVAADRNQMRWLIPVETFTAFVCTGLINRLQILHANFIAWT